MTILLKDSTPGHRKMLEEDLASENGVLGEDDKQALTELGIDPVCVDGVPHRELFQQMRRRIHQACGGDPSASQKLADGPGKKFADDLDEILGQSSYEAKMAAMGVATECLVPAIYQYLLDAIMGHTSLSPSDYVFLLLHIHVDEKHGSDLAGITADLATTNVIRVQMLSAVRAVLEARVRLWGSLLSMLLDSDHQKDSVAEAKNPVDTDTCEQEAPEVLYDRTSNLWARTKPNCLSDFTARPFFFDLCRPYVAADTWILDLGCGEGYCTRTLRDFGPEKVVGVDISQKMIDLAKQAETRDSPIFYFQGNALETRELLGGHFLDLGLTNKEEVSGKFGLITAVFLFNYMPVKDMRAVGQQVLSLLAPEGRFIFTVPHPSLRYWDRKEDQPFFLHKDGSEGYFEDVDQRVPGAIFTKDGQKLNIQSVHKTMTDYFQFLLDLGFVIEHVKELGTDKNMVAQDPDFFKGVSGVPLHMIVQAIKPEATVKRWLSKISGSLDTNSLRKRRKQEALSVLKNTSALHDAGFLVPPKEVLWSCFDYGDRFVLEMPDTVVKELVHAARKCMERGIDHTNYQPGDAWPIAQVKRFCQDCANRLMRKHGNLIVQGLDIDALADTEPERERMSKLCYYILMTSTGNINTTRGRLFDVKDHHLDVRKDNVLFSATSQECGWHSDGSSRTWFPDMVCLLCIRPADAGGEFQIANACNAYHDLCTRLPKFLMYELVRPVVRDIIEKGASAGFGRGVVASDPSSFWVSLSRQPRILRQRIRLNSYPIFERNASTGQSKFRFLDYWLESGHAKAGLRVSPLLKIAMTELNRALDRQTRFDRRLERGEIAMANNHLLAHKRKAFTDHRKPGRLLVRCWMKVDSPED